MIIEQGNKTFFSMERCGITIYYVSMINGRHTTGRQGSYIYVKCDICGRIVGTQFNGHIKHFKTHNQSKTQNNN